MAFIRAQKLVRNDSGEIVSGSASIVDVEYVKDGKYHSRQNTREKLGKVVYLSEDKKVGIFQSPTRGLVEYDSVKDRIRPVDPDDPRIGHVCLFPEPLIHTVFGDSYLLLCHMRRSGMMAVLREVFVADEDYERVLLHQSHTVLKDGSHIHCDHFVEKSFLSYIAPDIPLNSLSSDTQYFTLMGDDGVKVAYFKAYIRHMRRTHRGFGNACYLDSTPLPNDSRDNPFCKLCSHGLKGTDVQMRLALFLDQDTGKPVWFDVIPGNMIDMKNLEPMLRQVETTLGIDICSLVLDAGYVSGELVSRFNRDNSGPGDDGRRMIARMPKRNGYPFEELYGSSRRMFSNAKYTFVRNGNRYFGRRKEVTVFGLREYAYVYVDFDNALCRFEKYVQDKPEEYASLTDGEKTRKTYEFGYFVLISNVRMEPSDALDWYFGRMDIEGFFKTSKEYLNLLPISKWTDATVRGKILSDIVSTCIYTDMRDSAHRAETSMIRAIGQTQSLMCSRKGDSVFVEYPNRDTRALYESMGIEVPSHVSLAEFKENILDIVRCSATFTQNLG